MAPRETSKTVDINGRKWRLKKFDAYTGSFIAYQLVTFLAPTPFAAGGAISTSFSSHKMDKSTFMALQKDCLSACYEVTFVEGLAVDIPIIFPDGRWGVPDLENDAATVMALTIQTLAFNVTSFFDQMALIFPSISEKIQDLSSSALDNIGKASPMPQS